MLNIEDRIKKVMSSSFNIPINEISDELSHRSKKEWKGKNHLKMIELLESEFEIEFETDEKETLVSYKIIFATVKSYLS
jgi:hypothetical protein